MTDRTEGVERFVQGLAKAKGTDEESVEEEFFRRCALPRCSSGLRPRRKWRRWTGLQDRETLDAVIEEEFARHDCADPSRNDH